MIPLIRWTWRLVSLLLTLYAIGVGV